MSVELEQLRQLDAIAREGTMSAAARVLHISQPALSRSLGRLEAELGLQLFDRSGRRLVLNDAGRVALDHAGQLLRDEQAMRDALEDMARRTRALRVGTVAPAPLWRLTALMTERFPELVLTSRILPEDDVEAGVLGGGLELGITLHPAAQPVAQSCLLMEENLSVALPVGHPLATRPSLSTAELDGETFLLFEGIGFWRGLCDERFPNSEFVVQEDRAVFEQLTRSSSLPYFVTDAPFFAAQPPGRAVVPIHDAMARATFHLLVRAGGRRETIDVFEWVAGRGGCGSGPFRVSSQGPGERCRAFVNWFCWMERTSSCAMLQAVHERARILRFSW